MLDSAGAATPEVRPKANKGSTKSAQRFWPENLAASLPTQPSISTADDSDPHVSDEVRTYIFLLRSVAI